MLVSLNPEKVISKEYCLKILENNNKYIVALVDRSNVCFVLTIHYNGEFNSFYNLSSGQHIEGKKLSYQNYLEQKIPKILDEENYELHIFENFQELCKEAIKQNWT